MRQLADESGNLTLAQGYQPYGEVLESAESTSTLYSFTGEGTGSSNRLMYSDLAN